MPDMVHSWRSSSTIEDKVYIPKYYDETIDSGYRNLKDRFAIYTLEELIELGAISVRMGHEIGKASYGTGDIPFVRTSDIVNWEIKTAPKQGVSREIFDEYAEKQNVQVGDILFVRDGTYLIGRNCFITDADREILFQSHVAKIHVNENNLLTAETLFLALNTPLVQREIRSKQFTADIIDTLGQRLYEIRIPVPLENDYADWAAGLCRDFLETRRAGKAFIKHMSTLVESALLVGDASGLRVFLEMSREKQVEALEGRTVTSEFGGFQSRWVSSSEIENHIYLPKYYDPAILAELDSLRETCDLVRISDLVDSVAITVHAGVEPGKMAYGTGEIPFIRTSDFSNWEIASEPKQGISQDIYEEYVDGGSVQAGDVLLVRDGTYLVGSSCLVTESDSKALHSGGVLRIRPTDDRISPYLLLALLNSFVVKRQLRSKQFTRDVIDTLGRRYGDVVLPVPKSERVKDELAEAVEKVLHARIEARDGIKKLMNSYLAGIGDTSLLSG